MHPILTCILLLLSSSSLVAAENFTQCLANFKNDLNATGGVDSRGNPTSSAEAVGLTYKACVVYCGSGADSFTFFTWNEFSSSLSLWILPWLALIGRLPFGSGNCADDFVSVVMSVGSPALVAHSLALTSFNIRLVHKRAQKMTYEGRYAVARALALLQQTPLELAQHERLLDFTLTSDQWRREIVDRLDSRNVWSVATGLFVGCVTVAFAFTVANSFLFLDVLGDNSYQGHGLSILWLWLLCLVIGWFWIPAFTCSKLESAIHHVNQKAAQKAAKRLRLRARGANDSARTKTTNKPIPTSISVPGGSKRHVVDPVPKVDQEDGKVEVESIQEDTNHSGHETDQETSPLPNPAPQLPPESEQPHGHPIIGANPTANRSDVSVALSTASSIDPETDKLFVLKNPSPLNRDEFRFAATFNYSRVMRYLLLVDDVFKTLGRITCKRDENGMPVGEVTPEPAGNAVFPPGALMSMFVALIPAIVLQCGTTAAASIIAISTPTVGVGCHSLGYILYGAISIIIMLLTVISTILARVSETCHERSLLVKGLTASIAVALRRTSLFLAFVNATGLILLSGFQSANLYDNCYCNASVIGRGVDSYVLTTYEGWIPMMMTSRIVGTTLPAACMAIYMGFLWYTSAAPISA